MKISFCTNCMNRLDHLKQTLPTNIENVDNIIDKEYIILNYNSKDDMNEWVIDNFKGKVKLYHTTEPKYFKMSHAKNVVSCLATGDIIVNIDADNFIIEEFGEWVLEQFLQYENILVRAEGWEMGGLGGRIAISKKNYYKVRGYDEKCELWGFDDEDFVKRCLSMGLTYKKVPKKFNSAIQHGNDIRFQNSNMESVKDKLPENFMDLPYPEPEIMEKINWPTLIPLKESKYDWQSYENIRNSNVNENGFGLTKVKRIL